MKFEILKDGLIGIIMPKKSIDIGETYFSRNGIAPYDFHEISEYKKRNPLSTTTSHFAIACNLFEVF